MTDHDAQPSSDHDAHASNDPDAPNSSAQPAPVSTDPGDAVPAGSLWEDPIDAVLSPRELFARRRTGPVMPPLLLLLGTAVVIYLIMLPVNSIIMEAAFAQQDPEAAARMEQFGTIFSIVGAIFVPIGMVIGLAWTALVLFAFGRLVDLPARFNSTFMIAVCAAWIYLLAQVAAGILAVILGDGGITAPLIDLSFGVLRFVGSPDMPQAMQTLLARIDLFVIWQAVLWALGLRVFYRATTVQAVITAAAAWILVALPQVLMGLLTSGAAGTGA